MRGRPQTEDFVMVDLIPTNSLGEEVAGFGGLDPGDALVFPWGLNLVGYLTRRSWRVEWHEIERGQPAYSEPLCITPYEFL